MRILSIMLLLTLTSCAEDLASCVKRALYSNFDTTKPTGVTVEQAMKICGVK